MTNLDKEELGLRRHGHLRQQGGSGKTAASSKTRSSASRAPKAFAIMRTAKIKALANMSSSLSHTFRERDTPNADPDLIHDNTVLVGADNAAGVMQSWHNRAPDKIRKNAVHGLEYFVGGSPGHINGMSRQEQDQYFTKALDWLKDRHGAENILSAVIHRDETTPHLTVMTIPLDDKGKLNARHIVGSKKDLSELQTDFADNVGAEFGFERGIKRSQAKHQRVKRFYNALQDTPETAVQLTERDLGGFMGLGREKDAEYRQRVSRAAENALVAQKAAHDTRIRRMEGLISQKNEEIAEKDALLDTVHQRNDNLNRRLNVRDKTIEEKEAAIKQAEKLLSQNYKVFQNLGITQEEYNKNFRAAQLKIDKTREREAKEAELKEEQLREEKRVRDLDDDWGFD